MGIKVQKPFALTDLGICNNPILNILLFDVLVTLIVVQPSKFYALLTFYNVIRVNLELC